MYQVLGALLEHAGQQLATSGDDAHAALQRKRAQVLLIRVGRCHAGMFAALADENAILTSLAGTLAAELVAHGLGAPPLRSDRDPLATNTMLHRALDQIAAELHQVPAPWSQPARRRLRQGLAEAARVQEALIGRGFISTGHPREGGPA